MKKILTLSPSKIFIVCGLGLLMTLGAFWHYQMNQSQLDRINVLNQGVGTCFNRISQTFTAMMIRDVQSPYLHQGFLDLSNECLNETINGINPFRKNVGKGYETLNQLISETHWFHEKIKRTHTPTATTIDNSLLTPISDRFSKMEDYKISLVDEIETANARIRDIQHNDEILMGVGLLIFVVSLSLLSLQEFNRLQLQKEIEREALNYLQKGQGHVGAIVDRLVERALRTQNMPVTAQIFHDYHGSMLEQGSERISTDATPEVATAPSTNITEELKTPEAMEVSDVRTSLMEVLVNLQSIHADIQLNDVRDVQLSVDFEGVEQMMNAAVTTLQARKDAKKKIMITNQIHSDRSVVSFFLAGATFTPAEISYATDTNSAAQGLDMNLIVLKEMVNMAQAQWYVENKTDRNGAITGMVVRFTLARAAKEVRAKNLVSVVRGKKKDLSRELMN